MAVNECAEEHKSRAVLLLLNNDSFEAAKYLGITKSTSYDEAKQKLKDHYAITETKEELVKKTLSPTAGEKWKHSIICKKY